MSDIGSGIRTLLVAQPSITALISDRVWPDVLPQDAVFPAATYQIIAIEHLGKLTGPTGLVTTTLQIDAWAKTRLAANEVANEIRSELNRFRGIAGAETVRDIFADTGRTDYEPPEDGSDNGLYRLSRDYRIWHCEQN